MEDDREMINILNRKEGDKTLHESVSTSNKQKNKNLKTTT